MKKFPSIAMLMMALAGTSHAQPSGDWQMMVQALETKVAAASRDNIRLSIGVAGLAGVNSGAMTLVGSTESYPPASTIKMLLIATLMQQVDSGMLSLEDTTVVVQDDIVGGYGEIQNEPVPNEVTLRRLADLTVTVSDNTATNVLVDVVGYDAMQRLADELGLKIMQFGRKMFEAATPPEKENYITAEDSIQLLKAIYDGSFLSDESRQTIIDWMSAQTVKTKIGAGVPEGTPIAHKTGENASVTHDLGYLLWPGNEIALAIFAQSESTDDFDTVQATVNPVVAETAGIIYRHLNPSSSE
ncbi:class A beta-lactamase-related serine hydrolase [Pseudohongiella sp. SYSU M77423]|uniref:serine hydrolase n=1 Tax=Pseudohongiella sp. SYSU M77423 TaxID=3042312 RepID=UPI0024804DA0|nr:serine hydrolase [Pseudohongiella sp. SYSU M77423]MDH7944990.1 class A beta-lactamase-related serine hydrolase [Pseudohongiella sp. SYSU M77423]